MGGGGSLSSNGGSALARATDSGSGSGGGSVPGSGGLLAPFALASSSVPSYSGTAYNGAFSTQAAGSDAAAAGAKPGPPSPPLTSPHHMHSPFTTSAAAGAGASSAGFENSSSRPASTGASSMFRLGAFEVNASVGGPLTGTLAAPRSPSNTTALPSALSSATTSTFGGSAWSIHTAAGEAAGPKQQETLLGGLYSGDSSSSGPSSPKTALPTGLDARGGGSTSFKSSEEYGSARGAVSSSSAATAASSGTLGGSSSGSSNVGVMAFSNVGGLINVFAPLESAHGSGDISSGSDSAMSAANDSAAMRALDANIASIVMDFGSM